MSFLIPLNALSIFLYVDVYFYKCDASSISVFLYRRRIILVNKLSVFKLDVYSCKWDVSIPLPQMFMSLYVDVHNSSIWDVHGSSKWDVHSPSKWDVYGSSTWDVCVMNVKWITYKVW